MKAETLTTCREALEFAKQNQETFWYWLKRSERPSVQRARIDKALADLAQPAPVAMPSVPSDVQLAMDVVSSLIVGDILKPDDHHCIAIIRKWITQRATTMSSVPSYVPEPPWSIAPEWANWYTIDYDGKENWWEKKPHLNDAYTWWLYTWPESAAPTTRHCAVRRPPAEYRIDWRQTLTQRPTASD